MIFSVGLDGDSFGDEVPPSPYPSGSSPLDVLRVAATEHPFGAQVRLSAELRDPGRDAVGVGLASFAGVLEETHPATLFESSASCYGP